MKRVLAIAAIALLSTASSAVAAEIQVFQSSFDGTGSSKGGFSSAGIQQVAIDRSGGLVYVADSGRGVVDKFDLEGKPLPFSGLGSTAVQSPGGQIAVDNSGQPSHGNLYVLNLFTSLAGFGPDGKPLGGNFPLNGSETFFCNLRVGPDGPIYADAIFTRGAPEVTPTGGTAGNVLMLDGCPRTVDNQGKLFPPPPVS